MRIDNINELGNGIRYVFYIKPPSSSIMSLLPEEVTYVFLGHASKGRVRLGREDGSTLLMKQDQIASIRLNV